MRGYPGGQYRQVFKAAAYAVSPGLEQSEGTGRRDIFRM